MKLTHLRGVQGHWLDHPRGGFLRMDFLQIISPYDLFPSRARAKIGAKLVYFQVEEIYGKRKICG